MNAYVGMNFKVAAGGNCKYLPMFMQRNTVGVYDAALNHARGIDTELGAMLTCIFSQRRISPGLQFLILSLDSRSN